jgi:predicted acetyltransferase
MGEIRPEECLMVVEELTLVKPTVELKDAFLSMVRDFEQAGEDRYREYLTLMSQDFSTYIQQLENWSAGRELPEGHVPWSAFWLVRNQAEIIGVSHVRHRLTPALEREIGHIGYHIRPCEREKGYATTLLALTLDRLRSFGWSRVLVTCDSDNYASARVIEKNGGKLAGQVTSNEDGRLVSRFWFDL